MIPSNIFDWSIYLVVGTSFYWNRGNMTLLDSSVHGLQAFAVSSIFDKIARSSLANNIQEAPNSIHATLLSPIIEEAVYSGILLTQSNAYLIPRFASALATGMTAARALTGPVTPKQNKQGFTIDTKIGFLWAISRELLLQLFPHSAIPLTLLDSSVFALAEVSPPNNQPGLPKFSTPWLYKVLSSAFFRLTANTVATTHGIVASIIQHSLFNMSQTLRKRTDQQSVF